MERLTCARSCQDRVQSVSGSQSVARQDLARASIPAYPLARKANLMNDHQMAQNPHSPNDAKSTVGSVASDLRAAALDKYDDVVKEARAMADHTKSDVADEVRDVASALRRASEELRSGSAQEHTLGQIASSIADASDSIRDKDLGQIVALVSRAGRNNPALFLGGAALLGFAASRYAKASGKQAENANADSTDADSSARKKAQINDFVAEGNPNTQPVVIAS